MDGWRCTPARWSLRQFRMTSMLPSKLDMQSRSLYERHLVQNFSRSSGIPSAILRTGQIAGPLEGNGVWNRNEWLPSIVTSSKHLGALPETLGTFEAVDWIPVDVLALIMLELVKNTLRQNSMRTMVYNLVNSRTTIWSALVPHVQTIAGIEKLVALREWVEILEQSSLESNGAIVEINPALKLLDFMRGLSLKEGPSNARSMYEVKALLRDSQQASELTKVIVEWIGK